MVSATREVILGAQVTPTSSWLSITTSSLIDLSQEHGGNHSDHSLHEAGLSIDVRYLAAGGNSNPLNGVAGEDPVGTYRLGVLTAAQSGNVQAQRDIISWIRQNRI